MEVGLSLGSNLNDRMANLILARDKIAANSNIEILEASPVYETEPVGVNPEFADKKFLNAVLIIETDLDIDTLFSRLQEIEVSEGRIRTDDQNAPRALDIDIIYIDDLLINKEKQVIPHPRWKERRFVVQPLADIRPDLVLPCEKLTISEILTSLPETPDASLYSNNW